MVESDVLVGIGVIVVAGIGLQWVARLAHLPSIVLLLAGGMAVGRGGLGLVDADEIFGAAFFPVVSLAVGLLLFVGGLELRVADLGAGVRRPVVRLVTLGTAVTWALSTAAIELVFDESLEVSALLGAILVVSGPTVVGPLLRLARPADPSATILGWEGVLIDPIGATLALFCLNVAFMEDLTLRAAWDELVVVAVAGAATGLVAALVFVAGSRWLLVPHDLAVAVAVALVVAAYLVAENVRPEAGLFAATVMGLVIANQRLAPMPRLVEFGEPVVALLIGSLFIVLASQVEPSTLTEHLPRALVLVAVLVLVIRPVMVALCTAGSGSVPLRHRAFVAAMAPRGVVAASTAALFSLRLEHIDEPSEMLVPVTFTTILALALVYGLGAVPVARLLGVQRPKRRGLLFVSREPWALALAAELADEGVRTLVATRDPLPADAAEAGFASYVGLVRDLPSSGMLADMRGAVIASGDQEIDLTALSVLVPVLGRDRVWLLRDGEGGAAHRPVRDDLEPWARPPFGPGVSREVLERAAAGGRARTVAASAVPPGALPLVTLHPGGRWSLPPSPTAPDDARVVVFDLAAADTAADTAADAADLAPARAEREALGPDGHA